MCTKYELNLNKMKMKIFFLYYSVPAIGTFPSNNANVIMSLATVTTKTPISILPEDHPRHKTLGREERKEGERMRERVIGKA